ncbi:Arf1m [Monocercomonoides exilis]|uniref:Arf1m n=1 Tax=Monocercomonoides exilis TaxID=2049356 RepID=UPI00355A1D9E|nr:Arf1m [Monocercomonoides exilis]|eukprot:MONOS_1838.1-p1 / transcript=MONOS_1838.1 / gene=MONOS_1838 / organism=Monocercomonoides_exilis_PA203 / gene_product=Arf1m / transcript_product=Arf1m / location=Mono_scaffold00035:113-757(+) / protein_length=191 / sequence_SO=supercontig / SO=protein_coding / is_pseudo=false
MGLITSKIWRIFGTSKRNLHMIGFEDAGKTSILRKLIPNEFVQIIPILGANLEEVRYKRLTFTNMDIGGSQRIRRLEYHLCEKKDVIIFVIDSTEVSRLACSTMECRDCVKDELHDLLKQKETGNVPLLIYANKQDLSGAVSPEYILEKLELDSLCAGRSWHIQPCSALTGDGLFDGLKWLEYEIALERK